MIESGERAEGKDSPELEKPVLEKVATRVNEGVSAWRAASLSPLQVPLFRRLWIAAIASNFGSVVQMVGAAWAMTTLVASPHLVALVQTAALAPIVLLALPAGALADTADRRTLMLTSQLTGLTGTLLLIALAYSGLLTPLLLLACTALVGSAVALHTPAWQASFADFVPRDALPAAVGLNSLSYNVARSLGPALAGFIIAIAGAFATFVINAISFTGIIAVLATNKLPRAPSNLPPEPVGQAMVAGLRFVALSPTLKTIFMRSALFGFGGSAVWSLAPLITQERLHGDSISFGLMLGGFGAGSLIAAILSAYVRGKLGNEKLFSISTLAFGVATLIVGASTWLGASLLAMTTAGAAWIFVFTTTTTCIQFASPRWVVGRAVALSQVSVVGSIALGAATWGWVAEQTTLVIAFAAAAAFLLTSLVMVWLAPFPGSDFEDLTPQPVVDVRAPTLPVQSTTGPVFVTIEYQVQPERSEEFLSVMHALGRVRRRDGARRWGVEQDLDRPGIWIERIESATWIDHLRRANRGTIADQELRDRAAAWRVKGETAIRRTVERPPGATPLG